MRTSGSSSRGTWISAAGHSIATVALGIIALAATGWTIELIPLVYLAAVTSTLTSIDVREHRLPNLLVVPGAALGILVALVRFAVGDMYWWSPVAAGLAYSALLLLLSAIGGMGMGDVKLGLGLGLAAWIPFVGVLSPVLAFLSGGIGSVALLARGHRGRRIAFGPYLLGGFWLAVAVVAAGRVAL